MIYKLDFETTTTAALGGRGHDPKVRPWSQKKGEHRARGFEAKLRRAFFRLPRHQREAMQEKARIEQVKQRLAGQPAISVGVSWGDLRYGSLRAIIDRCIPVGIDPSKLYDCRYTGYYGEIAFTLHPWRA